MIELLDRNSHFVVPTLLALVVVPLALTLIIVGARSPYTHANLAAGFDSGYTRTDQALIGPAVPFESMMNAISLSNDPFERGRELFVIKGCASCHGLDGRGGAVGPSIVAMNVEIMRQATQNGMGGMPAFAADALSDTDLQAMAVYLKAISDSLPAAAEPQGGETPVAFTGAVPPASATAPASAAQAATPGSTQSLPGASTVTATTVATIEQYTSKIKPSLQAGAKTYSQNCANCHGEKGNGKGIGSNGLKPPPTDFTKLASARRDSPQQWYDSIENGRPGSMMAAWKGALSDSDIWNVVFYIRSFAEPAARIAGGKASYAQNCSSCHGDRGDGKGPFAAGANPQPANFTDTSSMVAQSDQALFNIVSKGKGTMPDFHTNFTDDKRWELIDYLWTFVYGP